MKIMIDLDKVVFNCKSVPYELGNRFLTMSAINTPLRYKIVDTTKAKQYKNLLSFMKFCNNKYMVPLDHSLQTLKSWNDQNFEINFVSTRPFLKSFQRAIVDWLEEKNINYNTLVFACTNKPKYCIQNHFDVMIDDTLNNCLNSSILGVESIWFNPNTNKNLVYSDYFNLHQATGWKSIDQIIQQLNKNKNILCEEEFYI